MISLLEFKLPEPDTRLVVFGSTVFKVKYKTSQHSGKSLYKTKYIQNDIKKITAAILSHILRTGKAIPVRSDSIIIYPGLHPWPVGQRLDFSHGSRELQAHPDVVLLLVCLHSPSKTPAQPLGSGSLLGKHKGAPLEDEQLPPVPAVPSSDLLARKRLRLGREGEGEPSGWGCEGAQPQGSNGATTTAALPSGSQSVNRRPPTPEEIALHTRETRERLHALSQPLAGPAAGQSPVSFPGHTPSEARQRPVSTFKKTVRYMKRMLGV